MAYSNASGIYGGFYDPFAGGITPKLGDPFTQNDYTAGQWAEIQRLRALGSLPTDDPYSWGYVNRRDAGVPGYTHGGGHRFAFGGALGKIINPIGNFFNKYGETIVKAGLGAATGYAGLGAAGALGAGAGAGAGAEAGALGSYATTAESLAAAEAAAAGTGAAGVGAGAGALANQQALYQMAFDAGLEGAAADAFVASGGTLGSTAAGVTGLTASQVLQGAGAANTAVGVLGADEGPSAGYDAEGNYVGPATPAPPGTPQYESALARIINGTATTTDWISVLGTAGATGLGMFSANQQANTLERLAAQSRADRAPFLQASQGWLANPQSYIEGPGQAALQGTLAGLSAKFGNPIGSGTALQLATGAGLQNWQNAVTGMANLGLSGEDTRAQLGLGASQAQADIYGNLAGGISRVVNPPRSLSDLFREYKAMGLV